MRLIPVWFAVVLAAFDATQAAPSISDGNSLYEPCVVCHQASAWGSSDGVIPSLAGQQKRYLEKQLSVFRSGARDTEPPIVAVHSTFSDPRDIVAVASYLSGMEVNPKPVTGSGDHLRVGQELYSQICAACHGDDGEGQAGDRVPRIGGQHYPYLRREIELASDLHKDLAPPEMTSALRSMRPEEKDALADYVSRLGSSEPQLESKLLDEAATDESPH
jgi:cytochrome c553